MAASQNQGQDNLIKAQKFIYSNTKDQKIIIVGSSLSANLTMQKLPNITNLAYSGCSIFDGLYMIKHSQKNPDVVLIETNFLQRAGDKQFQESIYSPVNYFSRKYIPILREEKQPLTNLGKFLLYSILKPLHAGLNNSEESAKKNNKSYSSENSMLEKLLPDIIKKNSIPFSENILEDRITELSSYVRYLKKLNTKVIFFEIPVNYHLTNSKQQVAIREAFLTAFPKETNLYINLPDTSFITTDGWHLNEHEAPLYTSYFKEKADILIQRKDTQLLSK